MSSSATIVDASGSTEAVSVGKKGSILITVRNTLTGTGTAVSVIERSHDGGESWDLIADETDTIDTVAPATGDYSVVFWEIEKAAMFRVRSEIDLPDGGDAATVTAVFTKQDASDKPSRAIYSSAGEETTLINANDPVIISSPQMHRGANILVDTLTAYDTEQSVHAGVVLMNPSKDFFLSINFGAAVFTTNDSAGAASVVGKTLAGSVLPWAAIVTQVDYTNAGLYGGLSPHSTTFIAAGSSSNYFGFYLGLASELFQIGIEALGSLLPSFDAQEL